MVASTLHTKYRPSSFDEIIGQDSTIKSIKKQFKSNTASHCYMLIGAAGLGKTSISRCIANEVNAVVIEVNAALSSTDDIREVIKTMGQRPLFGKNRVAIIDECHALHPNAWKALLKATEEPSEFAYWIFATTNDEKIPTANRNRSSVYKLKPIETDRLELYIRDIGKLEDLDLSLDAYSAIAELSNGCLRQALVTLSKVDKSMTIDEVLELAQIKDDGEDIGAFKDLAQALVKQCKDWDTYRDLMNSIPPSEFDYVRGKLLGYISKCIDRCTYKQLGYYMYLLDLIHQMPQFPETIGEKRAAVQLLVGSVVLR